MKKILNLTLLLNVLLATAWVHGQDLSSNGTNSWIFHTPDDGRTSMFVAPGVNGANWNYSKQTEFQNDGDVTFSGDIDGRKRLILHSHANIFNNSSLRFYQGLTGYFSEINTIKTGTFDNNLGLLFRTEKGGANGSSVLFDALMLDHEGNSNFYGTLKLKSGPGGYSADIVRYQSGQYNNNLGFKFQTEQGGPNGGSIHPCVLML